MLYKSVRDTQHFQLRLVIMDSHKSKNRRTETTDNSTIFYRNDLSVFGKNFVQQFFVQWLHKSHIVMTRINAICSQIPDSLGCKITRMAKAENSKGITLFQFPAFPNCDL